MKWKIWGIILATVASIWGTYSGLRSWTILNQITDEKIAGSSAWDLQNDSCDIGRNC